jgi:hypothetical protein
VAILTVVAAIRSGRIVGRGCGLRPGSTGRDLADLRTPPGSRRGGRHRQGGKMPVVIPATSDEPEPMIVEREMGEEGAGL